MSKFHWEIGALYKKITSSTDTYVQQFMRVEEEMVFPLEVVSYATPSTT